MQTLHEVQKDVRVAEGFCALDSVPFVVLFDHQRFCSPSCRDAWERTGLEMPPPRTFKLIIRKCRVCSGSFPVKVPHQRCCGRACKTIFDNKFRGYVQ